MSNTLPFGETRNNTELPQLTDLGYTGQILDRSSGGLMYYNARYYLPGLRRFISADTITPDPGDSQYWNRYSYVNNNPVNLNDPSGHCPWCVGLAVAGAAIGAALNVGYQVANGATIEDIKWVDVGIAVLTGGVAGVLIGTGVGVAAGAGMLANIGAGAAVAQVSYTVSTHVTKSEYNSGEMLVAVAAGGLSGGLTGGLVAGPVTSTAGKMAVNGGIGMAQYGFSKLATHDKFTFDGLFTSGIGGALAGYLGDRFTAIRLIDELAVPAIVKGASADFGFSWAWDRMTDINRSLNQSTSRSNSPTPYYVTSTPTSSSTPPSTSCCVTPGSPEPEIEPYRPPTPSPSRRTPIPI